MDCIIDKGTLDAILCSIVDIHQSKKENHLLSNVLREVYRCLKPNGIYILISMYHENIQIPKLQSFAIDWDIKHHMISFSVESLLIRTYKALKSGNDNANDINIIGKVIEQVHQMLSDVNFEEERLKMPDVSKIFHIYICRKRKKAR